MATRQHQRALSRQRAQAGAAAQLLLGAAWAEDLAAELELCGLPRCDTGWDQRDVAVWARRTLAEGDLLAAHDYRIVAMRLAGFSPARIKERAHTNLDADRLRHLALTVALRYSLDVAPMRPGRAGHRLVRDGLPTPGSVPDTVRRAVERAWLAGAPRAQIATTTGLTPATLAKVLEGLNPRLSSGDITARFGWSPENLRQKILRHTFPSEDGRDGRDLHLRWWWPATVKAWEAGRTLEQCPQCPARVERLGVHQRAHQNS